ncbi:hypothetical protein ACQEVG_17350 [Streptomyces sp. CA-135486]|uniref:hypothetical protein n=1 Tax=Streptomyces sp. CA-135486 TaxID=3240049 RepID=UPI003D8C60DB
MGMGQGQDDTSSLAAIQELVARLIREFFREPAPHASEERNAPERPQDRFVGRYEDEFDSHAATMAQAMEMALSGNSLLREMYERGQLGRTRELIQYAESTNRAPTSAEGVGNATRNMASVAQMRSFDLDVDEPLYDRRSTGGRPPAGNRTELVEAAALRSPGVPANSSRSQNSSRPASMPAVPQRQDSLGRS